MSDAGRRVFPVITALALLAGCGARPVPPVPEVTTAPTTPPSAECPVDGVRFSVSGADAAMGLRVLTLNMVNCGTRPFTVNGYPGLRLFDEDRAPIAVAVRQGSASIATVPAFDVPPAEVTLLPGEKAHSGLLWRNLVTDSTVDATTAVHLAAAPSEGRPWQDVPLVLPDSTTVTIDLGNTGELGTRAWTKA